MTSEIRITRAQTPCEKLTTYMNIINELALTHLESINNKKNKSEDFDDNNQKEFHEILNQIRTTIKDILSSLDNNNDDNYVKHGSGKKAMVHKAVKGWIEKSDENKKLESRLRKLYDLSAYELSEIVMTHICRYCVSKLKELLSSSSVISITGVKVKNLSTIYKNKETIEHLKVVLAILLNIRDILSGNAKDLRLLHKYITLEIKRSVLPTINTDRNLDVTVEEATEYQLYKQGTIEAQQSEQEEKDTRYKISHFIPYNNNREIKEKFFSQRVIPAKELIKLYSGGISETSTERINKFIQYAEAKLNTFLKALLKEEDEEVKKLNKEMEDESEGKNTKRLDIYQKIGVTLKDVYTYFISSWKQTNTSILKVANALKEPINDVVTILKENGIDTYPMLDIESTMNIEAIETNKKEILSTLYSEYLAGSISKDDILRNVLVYVLIRYTHTMYTELMTLMLINKQTLAFSKKAIRDIYGYGQLDVLEHKYPEGKEKLHHIAEIIASTLIAYVLRFYLKHYDKNNLNKDITNFSVINHLNFMLVNLESFQQTLFDIIAVTISKTLNSSTSDTFLVHNYMRMDNMMYLANIIVNSWPLFAPFFAASTANVWTVYREIENESFVKHDKSLGVIDNDIIDRIEKNDRDNPFIVFSHIPILWPWNRKSKGERQLYTEEKGMLQKVKEMYKEKIKDMVAKPSRSALESPENKPSQETQTTEMEEISKIIQHIVEGYNTLIDLRLVRINIFYQMNLVYEAYKKLRNKIVEHLEKGTTVKKLDELKGNDKIIEEDLMHPLFTKGKSPEKEYEFNINYVDFARDIYRYINTIITRLFFICGLGMQSESGYYIIDEGMAVRTPSMRNFTNWSKSMLISDSDYIRAAYGLIKGLSFVSSKNHGKINQKSKIVKWVANMLKNETDKQIPIVKSLIELSNKIQEKLDE